MSNHSVHRAAVVHGMVNRQIPVRDLAGLPFPVEIVQLGKTTGWIMKTTKEKVRQEFSFKAPGAQSVLLAGDFTGWQDRAIPLQPQGDGLWKITTTLEPGTHHYRFLVNGDWQDDPACTVRVPNAYGTLNAVRVVSPSAR